MKKISILLKLCYKFSKKYLSGYIFALSKPILFAIFGIMLVGTIFINPKFVICGFISIPFLCYAFWRGYVTTYGLIPCADNFLKETALPFENFAQQAKKQEKELAKYLCFIAIISILLYIPSVVYILKTVPFSIEMLFDYEKLLAYGPEIDNVFLINSLLLAPFSNFALCAFYYKKENENYFKLLINCYKNLDIYGIIIALIFTLIAAKGGIIYIILALLLNTFIYSTNTFWYSRAE